MPRLQVTQSLFGVTRWKVYSAKLHAGTYGAARNVPPSVTTFRIMPEADTFLNAFMNSPENVQLLADNKGASHASVALKQVPEKLWKKYESEVGKDLQVSRSKFLEYLKQPIFCLLRGKTCLCGPCIEHGTQAFEELRMTIDALAVAGLDKKVADSLQRRADALHDHLAHGYRSKCSLSSRCATRCIPFALSGSGVFGCACDHTHEMSSMEDNERFYLVQDLRGALSQLRKSAPAGMAPEAWAADLDERAKELSAFEKHVGLYAEHLLRKALSSRITSTLLEQVFCP